MVRDYFFYYLFSAKRWSGVGVEGEEEKMCMSNYFTQLFMSSIQRMCSSCLQAVHPCVTTAKNEGLVPIFNKGSFGRDRGFRRQDRIVCQQPFKIKKTAMWLMGSKIAVGGTEGWADAWSSLEWNNDCADPKDERCHLRRRWLILYLIKWRWMATYQRVSFVHGRI